MVTVIQGQASTDLAGSPPPSAPPITRVPTAGSPSEQQPEWQPPVTIQRVKHCRDSAERWAKILPWYANTMQRRADAWAMAAGIIAAVTGVAIWPVISDTSSAWEKAIVSAGALAAAVCTLPPRIKNHGEWAARARAIAGRYGEIGGELEDLQAAYERAPHSVDDATARKTGQLCAGRRNPLARRRCRSTLLSHS